MINLSYPVCILRLLIFVVLSAAWIPPLHGQVTKLSDFTFDHTKVLLLDLQFDAMLVVSNINASNLQLVKHSTGEVLENFPGGHTIMREISNGYLLRSIGSQPPRSYLRHYHEGIVTTLVEETFDGSYYWGARYPITPHIPDVTGDWSCSFSQEGLVFFDGETLLQRSIDALRTFKGWTAAEGRLFAYFDEGYAELDPVNFEVLAEHLFPDSMIALEGIAFESLVLLRRMGYGNDPGYRVADLISGENIDVVDLNGLADNIPGNWMHYAVMDGEYAVISKDIRAPYYLHFESHKDGLARIHLPTAVGEYWRAFHTYRDVRTPIPLFHTSHGVVALGNFFNTGIEPYLVEQEGPEIIRDIHPGTARSIEIPSDYGELFRLLPFSHVQMHDMVYFVANHPREGREVWCSDGSAEGTKMVCEFYPEAKGMPHVYFASSTDNELYAVAGEKSNEMHLYRLNPQEGGIDPAPHGGDQWQRSFGQHDANFASQTYFRLFDSKPEVASDGSVAILYQGYGGRNAWMAFDANKYLSEDYGEYSSHAFSSLQILNKDGSLRAMRRLTARSFNVHMSRYAENGEMVIALQHRPGFTDYDGHILTMQMEGTYLLGLDSDGALKWTKWIAGAGFSIRHLVYNDKGIFVNGFFDKELYLGSEIPQITEPGLSGFAAKFDQNGTPLWSAAMPYVNNNFGTNAGGLHKVYYDPYKDMLVAMEGGTGYGTSGSCEHSDWTVHVAAFDGQNGSLRWSQKWEVSDHIRPTGIASLPNGDLWISGFTRGDIRIGDFHLPKTSNFLNCSWNGFHLLADVSSGAPIRIFADEPEKPKFVFDVRAGESGVYVASLVLNEEPFVHPVSGQEARYDIQIDTRSVSGRLTGSEIIPTAARLRNVQQDISHFKLGMAYHSKFGNYLTVTNTHLGRIGIQHAMSSQQPNGASLLVMRIPALAFNWESEDALVRSDSDYLLFPNPTNRDDVFLQLRSQDQLAYREAAIYDVTGRQVHRQTLAPDFNVQRIQLPVYLANGVYIVSLEGTQEVLSEKLIIDR